MRPTVPDPFSNNPRKSPVSDLTTPTTPFTEPHRETPETFFLAQDDEVQGSRSIGSGTPQGSSYGVRSLEDTINEGTGGSPTQRDTIQGEMESGTDKPLFSLKETENNHPVEGLGAMFHELLKPSPSGHSRNKRPPSITPSILESPAEPTSLPSSPRSASTHSFKPMDDISIPDENGSQAIASSNDDNLAASSELDNSAPQLVMPSIKMPSRRPFTDRGKAMGRLKLLMAGSPGKNIYILGVLEF